MEEKIELGTNINPSFNDLEKAKQQVVGCKNFYDKADFIISIGRSKIKFNSKIKVIRSKFTPSK